jgi:two-component system OmpR family sensor kinase
VLVVFAAVIYAGARDVLLSASASHVADTAQQLQRELQTASQNNPFGAVTTRTALGDQTFLDGFSGTGLFIEAYNQYGRPIGKSTNLGTADIPTVLEQRGLPRRLPAVGDWGIAQGATGRLLVVRVPLRAGSTLEATVDVAESLASMDAVLARFRRFLLIGLAVALAFIALASLSLARAALGPIGHITQAARDIGSEDLSKRLNWTGRADEVGLLARAFDDMLARLESSFARERRFIADASHELKTPLTVINANAQMLARWGARNPDVMAEALATIEAESATMARVINAMLTLAKTDDPAALTLEPVDLRRIVTDAGNALQTSAHAKGLVLRVDAGPGESPVLVRGEPGLLRQLVTNLADNAIKFTQQGGVTLSLEAHDGIAHLAIADTGPGIPPDALPHIFERFYRADPARSRNVEGTGLGLAVVQNIIRVHGGDIQVHSRPGQGTCFDVTLPLLDSAA